MSSGFALQVINSVIKFKPKLVSPKFQEEENLSFIKLVLFSPALLRTTTQSLSHSPTHTRTLSHPHTHSFTSTHTLFHIHTHILFLTLSPSQTSLLPTLLIVPFLRWWMLLLLFQFHQPRNIFCPQRLIAQKRLPLLVQTLTKELFSSVTNHLVCDILKWKKD